MPKKLNDFLDKPFGHQEHVKKYADGIFLLVSIAYPKSRETFWAWKLCILHPLGLQHVSFRSPSSASEKDKAPKPARMMIIGNENDQVSKGHLVDALACTGDEGRDTLRKVAGSCESALIRKYPNGETHL